MFKQLNIFCLFSYNDIGEIKKTFTNPFNELNNILSVNEKMNNQINLYAHIDSTDYGKWFMIFSNNNIIKGELINDPEHDFYKSFDIYYHNTSKSDTESKSDVLNIFYYAGHGCGIILYPPINNNSSPESKAYSTKDLSLLFDKYNYKCDLLIFDCCLLANLESAYQFRHNTKYILASEDYQSYYGYAHNNLIKCLASNNISCVIDKFIANNKINNSNDHPIGEITNGLTFTDATFIDLKYIEKLYNISKYLTKLLGKKINSVKVRSKILIDSNDNTLIDLYSMIQYLLFKSKNKFKGSEYLIKRFEYYFSKVVIIYKQSESKIKSNKSIHFGLNCLYEITESQYDIYQAYNKMDF